MKDSEFSKILIDKVLFILSESKETFDINVKKCYLTCVYTVTVVRFLLCDKLLSNTDFTRV